MKKNRIIFRADGNLIAGYGHVIRALSLASMLKSKYHIIFIIQKTDDFLKTQIKNICDEIIEIPVAKNTLTESKKIAKELLKPNDIVVLDGYRYDVHYQTAIKNNCFKLVCIDDIHDRHFVADVIINHSEGINRKDYSMEKFSKLYLGTPYAILRKSFLKNRKDVDLSIIESHRAFINMGGTDQQNYTQKALSVCLKNISIQSIDIVVGSFYPYKHELKQIIDSNKKTKITIHQNLSEVKMFRLMKKSSLAICSASTISYEYASTGGFLFVYQTVSNQKNIYKFLIKSKIAFPLDSFNTTLSSFKNKKEVKQYFENRNNYFSGGSTKNLLLIFENLENERGITIRKANSNDMLTYFYWANNPDVRKNSINTNPILLEDHKKWFSTKLKNKSSFLFIIEKNKVALGQVRFDKTNNTFEIDYSIDRNFRGKGYGEIIMKYSIKEYYKQFPNDHILAKAKESNTASNRVFEKLGFKKMRSSIIGDIKYSCYSTNAS